MAKNSTRTRTGNRVEKTRKKKDPNAPKRGLSAYMFFANDNRVKIREENPNISFGEVGKRLGEKWRNLAVNSEEKQLYEKKAIDDKARYLKEKDAYEKRQADANGQSDHTDNDEDE